MPVFRTRISTSLIPISGSGTSSSHKPGSALALTSARNRSSSSRRPRLGHGRICDGLSQAPSRKAEARHDQGHGRQPVLTRRACCRRHRRHGAIGSALATGLARGGRPRRRPRPRRRGRRANGSGARGGRPRGARRPADVLDATALETARDAILARFGSIDVLVNCAGGNVAAATVPEDASPFDVPIEAYRDVVDLNLIGTLLPIRVFGPAMQDAAGCSIVNVRRSRPLAR